MNEKDKERGLYNKFVVLRTDGRSDPGEKHYRCDYFVLDITHDPHATYGPRSPYRRQCPHRGNTRPRKNPSNGARGAERPHGIGQRQIHIKEVVGANA